MEYLLKASVVVAIFYLSYKVFLQRNTFFEHNRLFFLLGLLTAFLIPFCIIPIYVEYTPVSVSNYVFTATSNGADTVKPFNIIDYFPYVYILGVVGFSMRFLIQLISLSMVILRNKGEKHDGYVFVQSSDNVSPFSFFNWIVYNPTHYTHAELEQIITHEKIHVNQYHSLDILITQITSIVLWFNPFIWLYNIDLKQNLEFIADQKTQLKVNCKKSYQTTLLKTSIPLHQMALSNPFYNSLIKKRIVMLHKSKSKKINLIKYVFIIPLLGIFLMSFNTKKIYIEKETPIVPIDINDTYHTYGSNIFYEDNNVLNENTSNNEITLKKEKPSKKSLKPVKKEAAIYNDNTKIIIDKDMTDIALNKLKAELKQEGITLKFKSIKRNNAGEITAIKVEVSSKTSNASYNVKTDETIDPIMISINNKGNNISIGNAQQQEENDFVFISKSPKSKKRKIIKSSTHFFTDEDDTVVIVDTDSMDSHLLKIKKGADENTIFFKTKKDSTKLFYDDEDVFIIKKNKGHKKGIWTSEDEHVFKLKNGKADSTKIIIKAIDGKEPIYIVNGKELTKAEFEALHPNHIESISVFKGDKAKSIFGENGEDGVIVIEKKNDHNITIDLDHDEDNKPLFIIDGKETRKNIKDLNPDTIERINVLKGDAAIKKYGNKAEYGVIEITTKKK